VSAAREVVEKISRGRPTVMCYN